MNELLGLSSHRAALSRDGQWLAAIFEDKELRILSTRLICPQGRRLYRRIKVQDRAFAARVNTIRWSPEQFSNSSLTADDDDDDDDGDIFSENDSGGHSRPRILLSDGRDIQIFDAWETDSKHQLLFHLDFGDAFGKINHIDFAFDHRHVVILTDTNVHGTVLTIDSREFAHIKAPKFSDANSFALHPKGRFIAFLTRTDGKDVLKTCKIGESDYSMETTVPLPTVDAQRMSWSADGRFLAICDTASVGCKIYLFTADGQRLNHMDITTFNEQNVPEDYEGLGAKSMAWLASSNVFLVADFAGHIVLRRLNESYRWDILDVLSHSDQIDDPSTFVWQETSENEQLAEQTSRPFMLPAVSPQTVNGVPRTVEMIRDNCDGSMLATTSGLVPSAVWIWQGFRSPLAILSFREQVRQIRWHPDIADALVVVTASSQPRVHLWTKRSEPKSVSFVLQKNDATCGKVETNWLRTEEGLAVEEREERDSDYLFTLSNEKCFDIAFIEGRRDHVRYRSVLNDDSFPDS